MLTETDIHTDAHIGKTENDDVRSVGKQSDERFSEEETDQLVIADALDQIVSKCKNMRLA